MVPKKKVNNQPISEDKMQDLPSQGTAATASAQKG
jgi:hypothetical protein